MTEKEIYDILKSSVNFEVEKLSDGTYFGYGNIRRCEECIGMTWEYYLSHHYPDKVAELESLPWTKVVKDPYNPQPEEYPTEDGEYITMMDCNEHEVYTNTFRDGHFSWMNRTHIKWWMPILNFDELKK
jgi:hypothetical protein